MKNLTYIGIIIAIGILVGAANLLAEPEGYLASEGSSRGLIISKEAKKEALQARADRMLLYQDEIIALDADSLELQAAMGNDSDSIAGNNDENSDSLAGISSTSPADPDDGEPGAAGCEAGGSCREPNPLSEP